MYTDVLACLDIYSRVLREETSDTLDGFKGHLKLQLQVFNGLELIKCH